MRLPVGIEHFPKLLFLFIVDVVTILQVELGDEYIHPRLDLLPICTLRFMFEQVSEVLREVLDGHTCSSWHVLLLLLPIEILPNGQVMMVYKLGPQIIGKVFQEGFNRCTIRVRMFCLSREIPSVYFGLMAILSCDFFLWVSTFSYIFHSMRVDLWSPIQSHSTSSNNRAAPQQSLQLFATHWRGYTFEPSSRGHKSACHKSAEFLYNGVSHLHTLDCRRALRKLYKSSGACMNFK